jgi:hypothetical protein
VRQHQVGLTEHDGSLRRPQYLFCKCLSTHVLKSLLLVFVMVHCWRFAVNCQNMSPIEKVIDSLFK